MTSSSKHLDDLARMLHGLGLVAKVAVKGESKFAQRIMDGGLQDARTVFNAPRWPSSAAAGAPAATPAAAQSGELADAHSAAAAHAPAEPQILQTSDAPRQDPEPAQQPTAAAAPPAKVPAPPAPAAPKKFKFVAREASVPSNSVTRAFGFASLGASLLLGTARESVSRAWRGGKPAGGGAAAAAGEDGGPAVYSAFLSEGNAERLAGALCRMRGAALKLGQMLSIQDDSLLPPQFKAALDRVRAGADVMPRRQLDKVLAAELGRDWRSRVADFDDAPLAAASIGQVHAATLHDGRRVVMKIQYPGVAKSIEADVDNMMRLISVANILPKGLYVENAVAVAKRELALECDYRWEAQAQARFGALVAADPATAPHFLVPAVVPELCSQRVLTSEWVPGVHVDQVAGADQATRDAVGTRLLALTLKELYEWRFMQSDPNFANFLWDEPSGRLHLIDFGAAREYPAPFVAEYLEMVKACAERDAAGIVAHSTSLGFLTGDESAVMLEAHVEAAEAVGTAFASEGLYDFGAHAGVTRRVTELGAVMLKHRLTPPPEESYSLHRKLAGAFLACIKLRARVPCRQLFYDVYDRHHAAAAAAAVVAGEGGSPSQAAVA